MFLLKNKAQSILYDNIPIFFKNNIKNHKLFFEIYEFIINERINILLNLTILHDDNIAYYFSYLNESGLNYIYDFLNIFNNRYINKSISNQKNNLLNKKSLLDYNKIFENNIQNDFHKNYLINNNNFFNIINSKEENEIEEKFENNESSSLGLKENIKVPNKRIKLKKFIKASRYKGISRNKKKWQVYIMMNKRNTYLGSYSSEKFAAKIYDFMSIKKNGINVKTNFIYNFKQLEKIYYINFDIKNIKKLFKLISKNNILE